MQAKSLDSRSCGLSAAGSGPSTCLGPAIFALHFWTHEPALEAGEQGCSLAVAKLGPAGVLALGRRDWPALRIGRGSSSQFSDFAGWGSAAGVPSRPLP